ncbi:MAG: NAD-dependent epimerase/dehydratase family protein, partial [Acidimicrobiales bacterium]
MATLVTGGTGYIGSHTVVALHDCGREVVVLDDFSNSSPNVVDALRRLTAADLVVVEGDATRRDTLDRVFADHEIDSVIHFAAHKAVGESVEQPLRYYRNNLVSTITLAEVMVERGCESLVFSSSATVYGEVSDVPVTEEAPATGSINPYGWTKFMNEQILADTSAVTPLRVVLLRYFNPVGAHPSGLIGEDPRETPNNLAP